MIAEEIVQAKKAKQKRLMNGLLIVVSLTIIVSVLIYMASNFKMVSTDIAGQTTQQLITSIDYSTEQSHIGTQSPVMPAPQAVMSEQDNSSLRQAYLDTFTTFESSLKPELASIDIEKWQKPLADRLIQLENEAVRAFGNGQYAKAKQTLDTLIKTAEKTIVDSQSAFKKAMQQAHLAYESYDYQTARLAADTALMLDISSQEAQALSSKVELIPNIAKLSESIRVANVENKISNELKLIEELLAIVPEHEIMQQRADTLRVQLAESHFNDAISHAYRAIDNRQVTEAKKAIARATKIYPSRSENTYVLAALTSLESQLRFESHTKKAASAQKEDEWLTAKQELTLALKEKPSDKIIMDKLAEAERIVNLKKSMKGFLKSPYRLANKLVKTKANLALIQSEPFINKSLSLAKIARQLESVMNAVNTAVSVRVLSDNNTFITVRGVGTVGTTKLKIIELKPGPYTFEGKREGYKSKIIELIIPLDKTSYQLSVVADERI